MNICAWDTWWVSILCMTRKLSFKQTKSNIRCLRIANPSVFVESGAFCVYSCLFKLWNLEATNKRSAIKEVEGRKKTKWCSKSNCGRFQEQEQWLTNYFRGEANKKMKMYLLMVLIHGVHFKLLRMIAETKFISNQNTFNESMLLIHFDICSTNFHN